MSHTARATHKLNPKLSSKSRKRVVKMGGSETVAVLKKFEIADQVTIRRNAELLPEVITSIWRECFKHLDMHEFQQQLPGDSVLSFLRRMRRHFVSVEFRSELLQQQLNLLDRSGIAELPMVRDCLIRCDRNVADAATQWPLHTLPKFFKYLIRLQVQMPVQVGFIEHFKCLKYLTLHSDVSREALSAIWTGCQELKNLQLLGAEPPNIIGISQCQQLHELSINVACFNACIAFEVLQMPQLQHLELQQQAEPTEAVSEAICLVLRQRALDVHSIQLHGYCPESVDWLLKLQLNRCPHLKRLHFAQSCPQLRQLQLIDCKQLTIKLLHHLSEWRPSDKHSAAQLELDLGGCQQLEQEFEKQFMQQSSIVLAKSKKRDSPPQKLVQFRFLRPVESNK